MRVLRILTICLLLAAAFPACGQRAVAVSSPEIVIGGENPPLPSRPLSLKFAVIGDSGRWSQQQLQTAQQLTLQRQRFPFELVLMLGDNNYGDGSPESYKKRFEEPFKGLIEGGVKFYAALGNHDAGPQWSYPLFNMKGHRYYTFEERTGVLPPLTGERVRFFAVDTVTLDDAQLEWLNRELSESQADWKIVYLHHPLYTSGRYAFSSAVWRPAMEPILIEHEVDVVFAGHEHLYERLHPQSGVVYFVAGGTGSVRVGDLRPSPVLAKGYDRDLSFMLVEIAGDTMYFQTMNRVGETVDGGRITKRDKG